MNVMISTDSINEVVHHLLENTAGGTCEQLLSALCQQLKITDITSALNGRSVYEVSPILYHHMQLQCRVVARVVSAVLSRPIVTIYDLELEIAESENVRKYADLKLGESLTNLPDTRRYFGLTGGGGGGDRQKSLSQQQNGIRPTKSIEVIRFLLNTNSGLCLLFANSHHRKDNEHLEEEGGQDVFALVDGFARSVGVSKGYRCGIHVQNLQQFKNLLRTECSRKMSIENLALLVKNMRENFGLLGEILGSNKNPHQSTIQNNNSIFIPSLKIQATSSSSQHHSSSQDLTISLNNKNNNNQSKKASSSSGLLISFGDDEDDDEDDHIHGEGSKTSDSTEQNEITPNKEQQKTKKDSIDFRELQKFVYSNHGNKNPRSSLIDITEVCENGTTFCDVWKEWNREKQFVSLNAAATPTNEDFSRFETLLIFQAVLHFFKVLVPNSIQEYFSSNDDGKNVVAVAAVEAGTRIRRRNTGKYVNPELEQNLMEDKPTKGQIQQIFTFSCNNSNNNNKTEEVRESIMLFPNVIPVHFPLPSFVKGDQRNLIVFYGFGGQNGRHRVIMDKMVTALNKNRKRNDSNFYSGFCFSSSLTVPYLPNSMERALLLSSSNKTSFYPYNKFLTYDVVPGGTDFQASSNFMQGFASAMIYLKPLLFSNNNNNNNNQKAKFDSLFLEIVDDVMTKKFLPTLQIIACSSLSVATNSSFLLLENSSTTNISTDDSVSSWFVPQTRTLFCNIANSSSRTAALTSVASRELPTGFSTRGSNVSVQLADGIIDLMKSEIDFPENPRETLRLLNIAGGLFRETLIEFFTWALFLSPEILNFEARARGVALLDDTDDKNKMNSESSNWSFLVKDWTGGAIAARRFKNVYPITADGTTVPKDMNEVVRNLREREQQQQQQQIQRENKINDQIPVLKSSGNGMNSITKFSDDDDDDEDDGDEKDQQQQNEDVAVSESTASFKIDSSSTSNPFMSAIQDMLSDPEKFSHVFDQNSSSKSKKFDKLDQVSGGNQHHQIGDEKMRQNVARFAEYLTCVYLRQNNEQQQQQQEFNLKSVDWINQNEETGLPYDIIETYENKRDRSKTFQIFVEVKSAWRKKVDASNRDFFLTVREFGFAAQNPKEFHVVQIFGTQTFVQYVSDFLHQQRKNNQQQQQNYHQVSNNDICQVLETIMNRGSDSKKSNTYYKFEDENKMLENVRFRRTERLFESWKKGEVRIEGQLAVRPSQ